jgi:hypothetical protein
MRCQLAKITDVSETNSVPIIRLWCNISQSHITTLQSVGQSVLVSGSHLGPATNFSLSLKVYWDSCRFVILQRHLWWEDGPVIYCCCCSSPAQSSSDLASLTRGRGLSYVSLLSVSVYSQSLSVFDIVQRCIYNIYNVSFSPGSTQQIMP